MVLLLGEGTTILPRKNLLKQITPYLLGGCGSNNSWLGVWPKLRIWFSTASLITGSCTLSKSTEPNLEKSIRHLFKGISQWPKNRCTFLMMIHKITPTLNFNQWLKRLNTQLCPCKSLHFNDNTYKLLGLYVEYYLFNSSGI